MNVTSILIKQTERSLLATFLCENAAKSWQSATWKRALIRTDSAAYLILNSQIPKLRKKFLLFISHQVDGYFITPVQTDKDTC